MKSALSLLRIVTIRLIIYFVGRVYHILRYISATVCRRNVRHLQAQSNKDGVTSLVAEDVVPPYLILRSTKYLFWYYSPDNERL